MLFCDYKYLHTDIKGGSANIVMSNTVPQHKYSPPLILAIGFGNHPFLLVDVFCTFAAGMNTCMESSNITPSLPEEQKYYRPV